MAGECGEVVEAFCDDGIDYVPVDRLIGVDGDVANAPTRFLNIRL